MENKYQVKYLSSSDGDDMMAMLFKDGKPIHKVNVDHLIWEHFYKNKWVD